MDIEGELAVIVGEVGLQSTPEAAGRAIRLVTLVNDISLRTVFAREVAEGKTSYHGKSGISMAPVAATPDELGDAWTGGTARLPLVCHINGTLLGRPNAGIDMSFDFPQIVAHATQSRPLPTGTVIASGTVSNRDASVGTACIAERRMLETLEHGEPRTAYLKAGDVLRIEMLDSDGRSVFGTIEQRVVAYAR
jgi:fumarylacetoacetate (FAA) hydrolase